MIEWTICTKCGKVLDNSKETCPSCGKTLFKPNGRGPLKSFCINEQCEKFVPEEKRSYHKKASGDRKSTAKKSSGTKKSTSKSRKTKKEQ